MPATYEPIATTTLGSAAASITFSSIASTWTDLRLVFVGTTPSTSQATMQFNSDTGANYSFTRLYADGSGAYSSQSTNQSNILIGRYSSTASSLTTIDVFSYAGSTYKTVLTTNSNDENGSGFLYRNVGLWRSTSAITSIVLSNNGSLNFPIGTTATLYGIKNA